MPYTLPENVHAPQERWTLHRVIIAGEEGQPAYALGTWDRKRVIAARWNGSSENEVGWPRIFVHPCWHILDERLWDAVIDLLPEYSAKAFTRRYLSGED